MTERDLFRMTADYAADFVETLGERPIREEAGVDELYAALGGPLPEVGVDPEAVIASLAEAAEPGLVGIPSGRYFGFVIGGGVPAAVAADWLTSAWDQNAGINDVVLNQVLVRFGDGEHTRETIARVQQDGTCWLGGTEWAGEHAMRISVSNWRTTTEDVERSAAAILRAAVPVHA